jgi:predicted nucleic acid-binding Zn ribbon protein
LAEVSVGAKLAAMRVIEKKSCAYCGIQIEGIKKKKYCSESCKQKAKYERSKSGGKRNDKFVRITYGI